MSSSKAALQHAASLSPPPAPPPAASKDPAPHSLLPAGEVGGAGVGDMGPQLTQHTRTGQNWTAQLLEGGATATMGGPLQVRLPAYPLLVPWSLCIGVVPCPLHACPSRALICES